MPTSSRYEAAMTETARSVGFVGLGAMGMPMALNLLRAGHRVRAFDVSPAARTGFAERQGEACDSAAGGAAGGEVLGWGGGGAGRGRRGVAGGAGAGAAGGAEILVLMVATSAQVEAVLAEALPALPAGAAIVLHS